MLSFDIRENGDLSAEAILEKYGLQDHGPVQTAIDNAVIRYMEQYWAYDTGALANSAYAASDIGGGVIVYDVPYAGMMAAGYTKDGKPINYQTIHNPLAGAFPFERMIADHGADILEEARNVARHI